MGGTMEDVSDANYEEFNLKPIPPLISSLAENCCSLVKENWKRKNWLLSSTIICWLRKALPLRSFDTQRTGPAPPSA